MKSKLEKKLKDLPNSPGVYFFKDKSGEIIYVGKAASLRSRVRQYFHKSRIFEPKTDALVADITNVEWTELETELDALFFEAEMVRRYMPKYNILLRDDKSFIYVRIDMKSQHPTVSFTRRPLDDKAQYFGPYLSKFTIDRALKSLRRIFPYSTHSPTNIPKRACLQAQIGLCPGLEANMTSLEDYRADLKKLAKYISGHRKTLLKQLEKEMRQQSANKAYEQATQTRNRIMALNDLDKKIIFSDRESIDISKDRGLVELAKLLNINPPRKIEGFDISHMSGKDTVASQVVFVSGVPDKNQYRKFKSRVGGNDDFAHMREVMTRRFSERNIKQWGKPDLILIDGGKGQVSAAHSAMVEAEQSIPMIGLAKRYEEIILPDFKILRLPPNSDALKLLQRIRDESHRFALSYHSSLKSKRQTASVLDGIESIGPATKKKLIRQFGSAKAATQASEKQLAKVVGPAKAKKIFNKA